MRWRVSLRKTAINDESRKINCAPQSEAGWQGTLSWKTQWNRRASAQVAADVILRGMGSGQWVYLSMIVSKWVNPLDEGKGLTKSMRMYEKGLLGTEIWPVCEWWWTLQSWHWWTLLNWHYKQGHAEEASSLCVPYQTNQSHMSCWNAQTPRCERPWRRSNTQLWRAIGWSVGGATRAITKFQGNLEVEKHQVVGDQRWPSGRHGRQKKTAAQWPACSSQHRSELRGQKKMKGISSWITRPREVKNIHLEFSKCKEVPLLSRRQGVKKCSKLQMLT